MLLETDARLIQQARTSDDAAFRALMERHLHPLYGFCVRYTGNVEDAKDITQETFVKAWRYLNSFDNEKSFRTWLFTIARNSANDVLRKRHRVVFSTYDSAHTTDTLAETLIDTEPPPDEVFLRASAIEEVRKAVSTLKPQDQTILGLRYGEEKSFETIANTLRMSVHTVRSLHRRALILLRKTLDGFWHDVSL